MKALGIVSVTLRRYNAFYIRIYPIASNFSLKHNLNLYSLRKVEMDPWISKGLWILYFVLSFPLLGRVIISFALLLFGNVNVFLLICLHETMLVNTPTGMSERTVPFFYQLHAFDFVFSDGFTCRKGTFS